MNTETQQFQSHLRDLAERSYDSSIYTFTAFLTPDEQAVSLEMKKELGYAGMTFFGGAQGCERQILRFGNPENFGYEVGFPIRCLLITPVSEKFGELLSHRDVLGALMHLGIKREVLGDIIVREKRAFVFCAEQMADYLTEELVQIRHTSVSCRIAETVPEEAKPVFSRKQLVVSSLRCDILVAKVFHLSRKESLSLFREQKIFVNGRKMENNSGLLKEGDVVSVRGHGKFLFQGQERETKKGNLYVDVDLYS